MAPPDNELLLLLLSVGVSDAVFVELVCAPAVSLVELEVAVGVDDAEA